MLSITLGYGWCRWRRTAPAKKCLSLERLHSAHHDGTRCGRCTRNAIWQTPERTFRTGGSRAIRKQVTLVWQLNPSTWCNQTVAFAGVGWYAMRRKSTPADDFRTFELTAFNAFAEFPKLQPEAMRARRSRIPRKIRKIRGKPKAASQVTAHRLSVLSAGIAISPGPQRSSRWPVTSK